MSGFNTETKPGLTDIFLPLNKSIVSPSQTKTSASDITTVCSEVTVLKRIRRCLLGSLLCLSITQKLNYMWYVKEDILVIAKILKVLRLTNCPHVLQWHLLTLMRSIEVGHISIP